MLTWSCKNTSWNRCSKNAICTICRGWMAAGYQMKGNIAFYLPTKYFSILTSRFSAVWDSKGTGLVRVHQSNILPDLEVSIERQMHKLPRLNGCGISNERQYCCLSAGEIFVTFNEPFFRNMSLTEVLSFGGCVDMVVQEYILISMFQERHMHNLPRLNGCWVSNERQYCFLSAD